MTSEHERRLLGRFIRSHRERARPTVPTPRRRTPGLRREELADLAGMGATWVAWLEQGRDIQASPEALARLAVALSLTAAERAYLFELAGRGDPDRPRPAAQGGAPASIRALVALVDHPAYGLDAAWTLRAWNGAARRLFGAWLGEAAEPNLLRYVFLDPRARQLLPDWEARARRILAEFHADIGGTPRAGTAAESLIRELRERSALFRAAWEAQDVLGREGGMRHFNHPEDGPVAFEQHTFVPAERPDAKLVLLVPIGRDGT